MKAHKATASSVQCLHDGLDKEFGATLDSSFIWIQNLHVFLQCFRWCVQTNIPVFVH